METKVHVRIGAIELEYEGSEAFLRDGFLNFLLGMSGLDPKSDKSLVGNEPNDLGTAEKPGQTPFSELSTSYIASKLSANDGQTLLLAAAAYLTIGRSKTSFTRKEILAEMQSAPSFYKKVYSNNLSRYLKSAVKSSELREVAKETYALSNAQIKSLGTQISDE